MESPISCHSPSSLNALSPQVLSPQPRRNPFGSSRKQSIPFLDLMEEAEDTNRHQCLHELLEKVLDSAQLPSEDPRPEDTRPPTRANNPQIHDQHFVEMDMELRFSVNREQLRVEQLKQC